MSILRIAYQHAGFTRNLCSRYRLDTKIESLSKVKRDFITHLRREFRPKTRSERPSYNAAAFGIGGIGIATACVMQWARSRVLCEADRTAGVIKVSEKEPTFPWARFFQYLYPHVWHFLLALASALAVAVLNIWIPQCMSEVINVVAKLSDKTGFSENTEGRSAAFVMFEKLTQPTFRLARMYVSQALFTFVYIYTLSGIGEKIAMSLRQDLFKSVIMQDMAFFDRNRTGEIVNRLTSDIQDFKSAFKMCFSQGLKSITQIVGCVISIIMISPQLTGVMVMCVPTIILVGAILGSSLRKMSSEAQNQTAKSTTVSEEAISNIRTVRAFAAEEREIELFSNEVELAAVMHQRLGFGIGLFQGGTNLFLNGIVLGTLYLGGHLMSIGQLTPGDLMAFLMATQTIQRSLTQLSLLFGSYVRGISAGSRVFEFLDLPPSPLMIGGNVITDRCFRGNIEFENVTFEYPTRPNKPILKNFNLNIPAGKTVAIVGASGNGKTTVAALLERLYDVDEGSIKIDGTDIRTLNSSYLRGGVLGYINQEPVLFATTIMENIRYGMHGATDSEVIEAAKEANADEFIRNFPQEYNTLVGERGTQLSGGQKQRVAIARALLKKPSILILDEATSALDYESERVVQRALDSAAKGRTVLIIAHRLSTIKNADIIVVLQNGVIVEIGKHDELTMKNGVYYNLVNQQEKQKKEETENRQHG
ncbi:mitochondrial potassium channel ATP-binding subunit isoform X1 [Neodiprion fabricii]|uniref:mitochondrial potassium channel ATP-binding subunit isoform X1 n=2 Tax=Neodiprion fabricii TaxID=2872261 RepID=UPI001ED8EB8F|nr:mitochondrial potassium channel ATP-binding subunit isoform X1 [Neodiprion fabricii]